MHNRQGFNEDETIQKADYGRNAGLEFNYTDLPGKFSASSALHLSKRPDITSDNVYYVVYANYRGRNLNILTDYNDVGDNFYAELGLFQRMDNRNDVTGEVRHLGYRRWFFRPQYAIRPQGTIFNQHQINGQNQSIWYRDGQLNERTTSIQYQGSLRNTAQGTIQVGDNEVFLLFPTRFTSVPLPSGTYRFQQFSVNYQTDARKILALQFGYQVGGFYNGKLDQYNAQVTYRQQPWGNFTLGYTQNNINLPDEYGDAELHLINFRTEINFSTSVFWTTFYQFNTQANNFNINSRLQWRFKPMSDLFLVYTDNYTSDFPLSNKNRGIVLRLNYWLTL